MNGNPKNKFVITFDREITNDIEAVAIGGSFRSRVFLAVFAKSGINLVEMFFETDHSCQERQGFSFRT